MPKQSPTSVVHRVDTLATVTANVFFNSKRAAAARGFDSVEDMNHTIIDVWNRAPGHPLTVLGNFGIGSVKELTKITEQILRPVTLCPGPFDKPSVFHTGIHKLDVLSGKEGMVWHDYHCGGLETSARAPARRVLESLDFLPVAPRGIVLLRSDSDAHRLTKLEITDWAAYVSAVIDLRINSNLNWHVPDGHLPFKLVCVNFDIRPKPADLNWLMGMYRKFQKLPDVKDARIFTPETGYYFDEVPETATRPMNNRWGKVISSPEVAMPEKPADTPVEAVCDDDRPLLRPIQPIMREHVIYEHPSGTTGWFTLRGSAIATTSSTGFVWRSENEGS